jgi:molybdopterin-guanine dinucleotide biosynthesis protein A
MTAPRAMFDRDRTSKVAGVILAGGRNSRMGGADKAFLRVSGQTVVERTIGVLRQVCEQIIVVTNLPEKYASFDVEVTSDHYPARGPLAGIHAALGRVTAAHAFVVACDMPFLRIEPVRYLVRAIDCSNADAVVPWWDGDIEPLHAVYATHIRDNIDGLLQRGSGAVRDLLAQIRVTYVAEPEMRAVIGAEESFRNVNTPEDAARFAVQV